jgi:hypothetical protein
MFKRGADRVAPEAADVLAFAQALQAAAAARFGALARSAEARGEAALGALFTSLAAAAAERAEAIAARKAPSTRTADPARARGLLPPALAGEDPDAEELRSALLTPYRALALAVRAEERAFACYAHLAAAAPSTEMRELAEALAREALAHAASLRHARRRAFHAGRPAAVPATLAELRAHRADWEREAAADPSGGLARLLERYLLVAERAGDEAVLGEAQRLADATLRRLARPPAG